MVGSPLKAKKLIKVMTKESNVDPGHYIGFGILLLLFILSVVKGCAQTKAQYDTVMCKIECIDKYVEEKTTSGKIRHYAIYNDTKNDISELIPVSQSVLSYIKTCEANNIRPSLGIKLKDGQISSIIRFKNKYIRKWGKR